MQQRTNAWHTGQSGVTCHQGSEGQRCHLLSHLSLDLTNGKHTKKRQPCYTHINSPLTRRGKQTHCSKCISKRFFLKVRMANLDSKLSVVHGSQEKLWDVRRGLTLSWALVVGPLGRGALAGGTEHGSHLGEKPQHRPVQTHR